MRITVDEARAFFADPSQQIMGATPDKLPGDPVEYWARGDVCWIFHQAFWPGVWMAHFAMKPEGRGRSTEDAKAVLHEFWNEKQPLRLIGWTPASNRAALAFTRRVGAVRDGVLPLPDGEIIMQGWAR